MLRLQGKSGFFFFYLQVFLSANTRISKSWVCSVQSAASLALASVLNYTHWSTRMTVNIAVETKENTHAFPSSSIRRAPDINLFEATVNCQMPLFTLNYSLKISLCKYKEQSFSSLWLKNLPFLFFQAGMVGILPISMGGPFIAIINFRLK